MVVPCQCKSSAAQVVAVEIMRTERCDRLKTAAAAEPVAADAAAAAAAAAVDVHILGAQMT